MSVTTTANPITRNALSVLEDYEVHHSGDPNSVAPAPNEHPAPTNVQNPPNWPTNHRRVPAYRPANTNLSYEERNAGNNAAEYVFIQGMLHGVWLNAVSLAWSLVFQCID